MRGNLPVGATLREAFAIYRDHAAILLSLSFGIFLVVAIVEALASGVVLSLIASLIGLAGVALYEGITVGLVDAVRRDDSIPSAGDLIRLAAPFVLPLTVVGILAFLGIAIGFVLLIAPALIFVAIWAVVVPVVVVERAGIWKAFGRSRQLVEGNGVRVFAIVALGFLVAAGGALLFEAIRDEIADGPFVRVAFGTLAAAITGPIYALVTAVLYFRLRGLEEALAPADPVVAS